MPSATRVPRPAGLAALGAALCLLGAPSSAGALSAPPAPVVFVHGLASDAETWTPLAMLLTDGGWRFGGHPTYDPLSGTVGGVAPGDFYTMNFSDWNVGVLHSQFLTLDRQGYELAAIVQAVITANPGASQVILVAHSMGGLAAREYLEGLARLDGGAPVVPYRGDVARLIGIGTPHLGSPLAAICQSLPLACLALAIDGSSVAVSELIPGSTALQRLNDTGTHPLPPSVAYGSIAGLGGVGPAGDGDGIVTRTSQEYLATLPGLAHRLEELTIPARADCGATISFGQTVVFSEGHTCESSDPGVWAKVLDAILEPRLILSLNANTFGTGDPLVLTLASQEGFPDAENVGDLYVGVLLPDGSAYLLTGAGFVLAFDGVTIVPQGLQPFRQNTTLTSGQEVILSTSIAAPIPSGSYTFVAFFAQSGAAPEDPAHWLSNLAEASFTFAGGAPLAPAGAPGAAASGP